jgi:hypothetical protein
MCVGCRHAVEDGGAQVVEGSRLTFNGLHGTISHKIELFSLCILCTVSLGSLLHTVIIYMQVHINKTF